MAQYPYILCVEDDLSSSQVLEVLLREIMGFTEVTLFNSSENFFSRLTALPKVPDLIFLDIQVKPYTGVEMFQMIRGSAQFEQTLIIALTASVMSNEIAKLREVGFKNLIGKPINPVTFPIHVMDVLSGKEIWDPSWA
jgi:CheY-like chemotaxis protein